LISSRSGSAAIRGMRSCFFWEPFISWPLVNNCQVLWLALPPTTA